MNAAAEAVMKELPDLVLAYGNSDEYRYAGPYPIGCSSCLRHPTIVFIVFETVDQEFKHGLHGQVVVVVAELTVLQFCLPQRLCTFRA